MEKAELVTTLTALIDRYAQHQQFIDRARSQVGKFSPAVVEKVVKDHSAKADVVADEVRPLLAPLAEHIGAIETERNGISSSKGGMDDAIQELDLRLAIGEMSQEEYDEQVGALKGDADNVASKLGELDGALAELVSLRDRWQAFRPEAVVAAPPPPEPEPEPAPEPAPEPEPAPVVEEEEIFATRTDLREDVSAIFAEPAVAKIEEEVVAIETAEIGEDPGDGPSADVPFGFDDEAGDIDLVVQEPQASEVEIDVAIDAGAVATPSPEPAKAEEPQRRALLLYQEGTAEEQIYPFTGDALTIGRGRENDIQIKADSKVSRYHCKLFRRGNSFYIEDIKSSNGTLVNGELITDRRLFGGEEIIIGETFFRFRIME